MSEAGIAKAYWNRDTLEEAKNVIVDPLYSLGWEGSTTEQMEYILPQHVIKNLPDNDAALEIGCGIGRLMVPMEEYFLEVEGIDISEKMIDLSKDYLAAYGFAHTTLFDGVTFPFAANRFDFVYSALVFQHIPRVETMQRYLHESFRVLRPGGVIRIQAHRGRQTSTYNGTQGYYFSGKEDFQRLFEIEGFEILSSGYDEAPKPYIWVTGKMPGRKG